jgi:hypothetical protein
MQHSIWWHLGQFAIVVAWGAILIAGVVAIWYLISYGVLTLVSHIFPLRGWKPGDHDPTGSSPPDC